MHVAFRVNCFYVKLMLDRYQSVQLFFGVQKQAF